MIVEIGGKTLYISDRQSDDFVEPKFLLIQPVSQSDIDKEASFKFAVSVSEIVRSNFVYVQIGISDWNKELSPWEAEPVFGDEGFGNGAKETLLYIENQVIPYLVDNIPACKNLPIILAGYSLAGLFSLWSSFKTDIFSAITAVSPSVWFPGWTEYAKENEPRCKTIYLSLGDKEEKTNNPIMKRVGECIRQQYALLTEKGCEAELVWNQGGHFNSPNERIIRGIVWCASTLPCSQSVSKD